MIANHTLPDFDSSLSVTLKVDKKDLEQKYQNRVYYYASFFDKVFIVLLVFILFQNPLKYIDITFDSVVHSRR